ncbi:MAG: YihY/virulence factor BrkB family protein [Acidobacteriota bacterium]|nr:YihY/virulence factor BrkB family protein [Acidobacteriota bacterium]
MTGVQRILTTAGFHVRQLLTRPREELSLWNRTAAFWIRLSAACAAKLRRDNAPQVAAALTYQTLFSLIPMLVLGLLVFQSVQGLESAGERLRGTVVDVILPESLVSNEVARVAGSTATGNEFDEARELLRTRIDDLLQRLSEVSFTGIGIVGFVVFLYGATILMSTIERSFNSIYQAEETRPLTTRLPLYFSVVTMSPVALVAAQLLQDRIVGRLAGLLSRVLAALAPLAATFVVLFLLFRLLPNTRVRWRCAASGAFVSAAAWLLFKGLFGLYLSQTILTSLYGALALVPLFLLWIYGSWLLVLFGLALAYSLQFLSLGVTGIRQPLTGDPRWFVPIMVHIGTAFAEGRTIGIEGLCARCQLSPAFLRPYLRILERRGLVRRAAGAEGERVVVLAKPAAAIRVSELLDLEPVPNQDSEVGSRFLVWLKEREMRRAEDLSLHQLLPTSEGSSP